MSKSFLVLFTLGEFLCSSICLAQKHLPHTSELKLIFSNSIAQFEQGYQPACELSLVRLFKKNLKQGGFGDSFKAIEMHLDFLIFEYEKRKDFFTLLKEISADERNLQKTKSYFVSFSKLDDYRNFGILEDNDIKGVYRTFSSWPKDERRCVYEEYKTLLHSAYDPEVSILTTAHKRDILEIMNLKALKEKYITIDVFNKLEYLRLESKINTRKYDLVDVLDPLI